MALTPLEKHVAEILSDFPKQALYLLGISGGRDSMALWDAMTRLGFRLALCHVNHGWRGVESLGDEEWVTNLAKQYGQPCYVYRVKDDVPQTENAARGERLAFFAQKRRELGAEGVFLAHHASDQVESMILALLRGAGLPGLTGMRFHQVLADYDSLAIWRPLLTIPRSLLEEHLEIRGIQWREDATNETNGAARNRIRHQLMPVLQAVLERDPTQPLLRFANLADEDNACLETLAESARDLIQQNEGLSVKELRQVPSAIAKRVLRHWVQSFTVYPSARLIDEIKSLTVPGETRWCVNVGGGARVRRKSGILRWEKASTGGGEKIDPSKSDPGK